MILNQERRTLPASGRGVPQEGSSLHRGMEMTTGNWLVLECALSSKTLRPPWRTFLRTGDLRNSEHVGVNQVHHEKSRPDKKRCVQTRKFKLDFRQPPGMPTGRPYSRPFPDHLSDSSIVSRTCAGRPRSCNEDGASLAAFWHGWRLVEIPRVKL